MKRELAWVRIQGEWQPSVVIDGIPVKVTVHEQVGLGPIMDTWGPRIEQPSNGVHLANEVRAHSWHLPPDYADKAPRMLLDRVLIERREHDARIEAELQRLLEAGVPLDSLALEYESKFDEKTFTIKHTARIVRRGAG